MSRILTDNNHSFNIDGSFNVSLTTNNYTVADDDKSKILTWLSPFEPLVQHQDIRTRRVSGVGDWLLQTKEFTSWYDGCGNDESDLPILFCYGDPGVGKSHLTSLVIDTLYKRSRRGGVAVTCFYFDLAVREKQSPNNILGSLLKQLLRGLDTFPEEIVQEFQDQKRILGGQGLQPPEIVDLFQSISSTQRTFICIDAIDECVPAHRLEVLGSLRRLLRTSSNTRIFMTGRSHVRAEIERPLGFTLASVTIMPTQDDITTYLRAIMGKDEMPGAMNSKLEAEILEGIPEANPEIFLLVSLQIEAILRETTISRRRKRLEAVANGLGLEEAYDTSLERINAQGEEKAKLGMATLMWICHSERPLKVDELRHALAVEMGSTDFDPDNVPSIDILLVCCQGLIAVDREASSVRLIHSTLQDYLSDHSDLFPGAHSAMSEACLTYLSSRQVKDLSPKSISNPQLTPFLEYSSMYWGAHAKRELSDHGKRLALKFLDGYEDHIAAELLFQQVEHQNHSGGIAAPLLFTALHCACFFGIGEVASDLIGAGCYDINQTDRVGATPLTWAARNGHEEVVRLLLGQEGIMPDKPDNRGTTPFSYAAGRGHEGVMKLLLGRGNVNPDMRDNKDRTPLSHAAGWGNQEVAKLLLSQKAVTPDRADNKGTTPLSFAAGRGHEGMVKLLLGQKDVNPDRPDDEGRTPLSHAAGRGHEDVVNLLLGQEVHPDRRDSRGRTPFSYAAGWGHEGVVKLLLGQKDVSPGEPDDEGRTPFFWAACNGCEGVVKLLLGRKAVAPNTPDDKGTTPFSFAAGRGHEGVVKLLLEWGDLQPNVSDDTGATPFSYAAAWGREGVVKLLLGREDIHPDMPDHKGRTPLSYAASWGHEGVVELLLGSEYVIPAIPDNLGKTPLSYATINEHEGVAQLLRVQNPTTINTV